MQRAGARASPEGGGPRGARPAPARGARAGGPRGSGGGRGAWQGAAGVAAGKWGGGAMADGGGREAGRRLVVGAGPGWEARPGWETPVSSRRAAGTGQTDRERERDVTFLLCIDATVSSLGSARGCPGST